MWLVSGAYWSNIVWCLQSCLTKNQGRQSSLIYSGLYHLLNLLLHFQHSVRMFSITPCLNFVLTLVAAYLLLYCVRGYRMKLSPGNDGRGDWGVQYLWSRWSLSFSAGCRSKCINIFSLSFFRSSLSGLWMDVSLYTVLHRYTSGVHRCPKILDIHLIN